MINTTYNLLPSTYANTKPVKYHSHKKSELKSIYNHIINLSRKSPVYLLNMTDTTHSYALSVKEGAMELQETMLGINEETNASFLDSKIAISSNPKALKAELISNTIQDLKDSYEIQIKQLATTQVNTGREFSIDSKPLKPGDYRFAIQVKDDEYEFQFNISTLNTSKENQLKLVDFLNQADIGIKATYESGQQNTTGRIRLESEDTGADGSLLFVLEDRNTNQSQTGIVDLFELDNVSSFPKNSIFTLNGEEKTALSNTFCLNKTLNITLRSSTNEPLFIDFVPDKDKVINGVESIFSSYNELIHLGLEQSNFQYSANKLVGEMNSIVSNYKNELESCGINTNDKKEIVLNESLVLQAANDGELKKIFSPSLGFIPSILRKSSEISLNPMNYVDKTIVAYKNIKKPGFYNPYITSIYSGMIFNSYC
jgi:flagellar hook-associated protein 2